MSGQGERATDHLWDARYEAQPTESIRRWSYCCERPQSEHPGLTWDSLTAATDAGAAGDAVAELRAALVGMGHGDPGRNWCACPDEFLPSNDDDHDESCERARAALASAEGATEVDGG